MDIIDKLNILANRVSHQDYKTVTEAIDEISTLRAEKLKNNENTSDCSISDEQ